MFSLYKSSLKGRFFGVKVGLRLNSSMPYGPDASLRDAAGPAALRFTVQSAS